MFKKVQVPFGERFPFQQETPPPKIRTQKGLPILGSPLLFLRTYSFLYTSCIKASARGIHSSKLG